MNIVDQLEDILKYIPGDEVLFYSPDADRSFKGQIEKVELSMDMVGCSIYYFIDVEETKEVGKYYGQHVITDDNIIQKL